MTGSERSSQSDQRSSSSSRLPSSSCTSLPPFPLLTLASLVQGILRIIYAYFMGLDRKDAPYVSIPLNTVIKLQPHAYGCHEERICLMSKDEMQTDGQDEPPTSMPRKAGESDDAVMNAPSC